MEKNNLFAYLQNGFYDENVGFTKLIKVLKPKIFLLSPLSRWIHMYITLNQLQGDIDEKNAFLHLWNFIVKKKV